MTPEEQHRALQMEVTRLQLKRLRREDNGRRAFYWIMAALITIPMLGFLDQCGSKGHVHPTMMVTSK